MPELHVATIHFLNAMLKVKQLQLAKSAHTVDFSVRTEEFENLRRRLCLEIEYALAKDGPEAFGDGTGE